MDDADDRKSTTDNGHACVGDASEQMTSSTIIGTLDCPNKNESQVSEQQQQTPDAAMIANAKGTNNNDYSLAITDVRAHNYVVVIRECHAPSSFATSS